MAPMVRMQTTFSVAAAILIVLPAIAYAANYVVGDDSGWTVGFDYAEWAKDKKFRIGDTLTFLYSEGDHNVVKVDGKGFANCATSPNSGIFTSGDDKITLTTAGNKWYICGVSGHCDAGQKLKITVLPKSMIGGAPPSPAPEPAGLSSGYSWTSAPAATPGYSPELAADNTVPMPSPDPAVPWFPWEPAPAASPWYSAGTTMDNNDGPAAAPALPWYPWAPVESPGYTLEGKDQSQAVPTMPPEPWARLKPLYPWGPAMPPLSGFPWAPVPT